MASPELSFVEPVQVVESAGQEPSDVFFTAPPRLTTFFEFDEEQRDLAVDELLVQAEAAGFSLVNQLPDDSWPLAKYTATDADGVVLSITVSATNLGVELT